MAQADSVPSSSRALITGESANRSTNQRAAKPPAVSVQPVDRHYFIARSDARVITNAVPLLWIWRERRPDVELKDLSNCGWYAASTGQEPLGSNIGAPVLRDRRLFAGAVAPAHSDPVSVPEQE
jgi:hypothetical protein